MARRVPMSLCWHDPHIQVYHHCSNQLEADSGEYMYSLFFCCTANVHQGWPKFVLSLQSCLFYPSVPQASFLDSEGLQNLRPPI